MRRLVTVLSLAALSAPVAAHAQIAEVELPPSDIADAGYDTGDTGYDVAAPESDSSDPGYDDASNDDGKIPIMPTLRTASPTSSTIPPARTRSPTR